MSECGMTLQLCNLATWQLVRVLVPVVLIHVVACGDPKADDTSTLPTTPPGSTTNNGSVAANISGEQFFGRLSAAATIVEDRLGFNAYDGYTRQLTFSVGAPGPGSFETGGPYSPVVSLAETSGDETRRWVSSSAAGFGSITLTFLSADKAVGHFSFALFPDSATVAAGLTTRRNLTAGTFDIVVSR
jgi:hypothetical protein